MQCSGTVAVVAKRVRVRRHLRHDLRFL
jgi:hypothetical protein